MQLAKIPEGWLIGGAYILPPGSRIRHGTEILAKENSHVLAIAMPHREKWRWLARNKTPIFFPITPDYTIKEIKFAENIMAGALIAASEIEEIARYETMFQGSVGLRVKGERRNFFIAFESTDRSYTKKICEVWSKDTSIAAYTNLYSKAFGHGFIKEIEKKIYEDLITIEIDIFLMPNPETIEQEEDFEFMVEGGDVFIRTTEEGGGMRAQANTLGFNLPSSIIEKEKSKRAEILKAILGRRGPDELKGGAALGNLDLECTRQLNTQQKATLANWLDEGTGRVHYQQAPPGTGKTRVAAACVAAAVSQKPGCAVLGTAAANLPISRLVEEVERTMPDKDMVAFFSGMAKVRYNEHIAVLEKQLLAAKVKRNEYKSKLENPEIRDVEKYLEMIDTRPRHAAERKVGKVLQEKDFRNVAFATIQMALAIPGAHNSTSHLVVDEATQVSYTSLVHLVCQMPSLVSLLLTGDLRQIGVHLKDLPDLLHTGFGLESITCQVEHCPRISMTALEMCYRAHPTLVTCFDYSSYRQHNEKVLPAIKAEDRKGLTHLGVNLPIANIPLVLLNICGTTQVDPASYSVMNPEQHNAALRIVEALEKRDPGGVVVICLYSYEAECLRKELREMGLEVGVHTTDAFQAQEKRLVVLVTTRTQNTAAKSKPAASEFLKDSRRATVALTRAQHGMVIIADFQSLSEGEVWARFVEEAQKHTPIVNEGYLEVMEMEDPSRGAGGILQDRKGWSLQAVRKEIQMVEESRRKATECATVVEAVDTWRETADEIKW
uniref:DNA2/NAM7 helicase-like C-terminal domain-containing protein n=1 Tax=Meloidogyne enterolobii TaxID=390850 RepID=A0A6V7XKN0_MELEN|nr:unnamed protein product [Meloidogyne enterolobii]